MGRSSGPVNMGDLQYMLSEWVTSSLIFHFLLVSLTLGLFFHGKLRPLQKAELSHDLI